LFLSPQFLLQTAFTTSDSLALRDSCGWTALHWAATGAQAPVIRLLLEAGAPLDATDDSGRLPLHACAQAGDGGEYYTSTSDEAKAAMASLLSAWRAREEVLGSCWRGDNHGLTPLHLAAGAGQPAMVSALLAEGADAQVGGGKVETSV
jgi:ankyrin repeat protein